MSISHAKKVLKIEAEGILSLLDKIGPDFLKAIDLIMECRGRVINTGIGKSGLIGQKITATFNSTGTPSLFLHPVEAMHGDLGIVNPGDVVIAISYSGETAEMNALIPNLKKRGVKIIAITGGLNSSLADSADAVLNVAVPREACSLGVVPTASTTATLAMGDALAVVLLDKKKFEQCDFRRNHPAGKLGERLKISVSEVMLTDKQIPRVQADASLLDAISVLNDMNIGAVLIMKNQDNVAGILTDGDIRRIVNNSSNFDTLNASDVMTSDPKSIEKDLLAADALSIMQRHEITILPVKNRKNKLVGILHLHDLLGKGEFRFLV
ncbi:MAG: KpsF/GutQ family sugar-phosphate isomerase [Thermodesulfobacteriota bacterium]|nr:KpsF/GutQ family sugar-phosphate isomerase [Thermodesulfobacteriota bacterium]